MDVRLEGLLRRLFQPKEVEKILDFFGKGFSHETEVVIASVFMFAKDGGKTVHEVLEKLNEEWERNWKFQHPDIRANPASLGAAGRQNMSSLVRIYGALGLPMPK